MNLISIIKAKVFASVIYVFLFLFLSGYTMNAKDKGPWHNKKCAVVLTYDDALNVHLDKVMPALDSLGFKATFYISGNFPGFKARVKDWKAAAKKGYELGNHSLFHPCEGDLPGREWVNKDYDLSTYSLQRMIDDITLNNILLNSLDGKTQRTFAYPCGDTKAGDSSYVPFVSKNFVGARGVQTKLLKINEIDRSDIPAYFVNGDSADKLIAIVKEAIKNEALIVFLFHGVGGEHNLNTPLDIHSKLIHFIKQNEKDIWVAPLVEVSKYIKEYNGKNK